MPGHDARHSPGVPGLLQSHLYGYWGPAGAGKAMQYGTRPGLFQQDPRDMHASLGHPGDSELTLRQGTFFTELLMCKMRWEQFRRYAGHVNRAFHTGLSGLLLLIGGVLFILLLPTLPNTLHGLLSGDLGALYILVDIIAGLGVYWLQWRYRHAVFPQLRRDSRRLKQQPSHHLRA